MCLADLGNNCLASVLDCSRPRRYPGELTPVLSSHLLQDVSKIFVIK